MSENQKPSQKQITKAVDNIVANYNDALIVIGYNVNTGKVSPHIHGTFQGLTVSLAGLMEKDPKFKSLIMQSLLLLQKPQPEKEA